MSLPRTCVRRPGLWLGMALVFLGALVTWLVATARAAPLVPNAVEVSVSGLSRDGEARRLVVRQHCPGPVILMNWVFEQKADPGWKRIAGETFPGAKALDRQQGYSFTVMPPAERTDCRVRVQYGVGLHGLPLWRERVRVACRTRRFAASLRYNEFEMGESVADLVR